MPDRLGFFGRMLSRVANPRPTRTLGAPGVAIHGGIPVDDEINRDLIAPETRYRTYSNILANTSIVAAGVRYFLNLIGSSGWTFTPSDADSGGAYRDRLEAALRDDGDTPWHRVVRRAAMYRMYGFSVQEWTMRRHEDGHYTYGDIAPRPQKTIHGWDVDRTGKVRGIVQLDPQTAQYVYLPRAKCLYLVDDSLHDSPEGLGLFRHLVAPAKRLERYTHLEQIGFESDLRGIPVGYGPFGDLAKAVAQGNMKKEDRAKLEAPLRRFLNNLYRNENQALLLDSAPYASMDQAGRPSAIRQWAIEILRGGSRSFQENAAAIERLNRELARILGVEQLLLGATSSGSYALSEDKTKAFYQTIEAALTEIRESMITDLIDRLWEVNGWPVNMKPTVTTDAVRYKDVAEAAVVLRDLALAGAMLEPDDPVINDFRDQMNLSHADLEGVRERMAADAALMGAGAGG